MGLHVKFENLGRLNGYLHSSGLVHLNYRKSMQTQRITLAHEMGHWQHGHDWTMAHDRMLDERQADVYAANLLISPVEYALAESIVGHHPGALAKELGVTRRLIELWQEGRKSQLRAIA